MRHFRENNLYRNLVLCILVSFDALYGISIREQNQAKSHMEVTAILVKAFTKNKDAGNPAGVILNADNLSDAQMQAIATQLGFSESVFVCKSEVAHCKMRYFSVTQEVDYCAHATVAAGVVLHSDVSEITYETNSGVLIMETGDSSVTLIQKQPDFGEYICREIVANALKIKVSEIAPPRLPQVVSTGVPKLMVQVETMDTLFNMSPDFDAIKRLCRAIGARGVYVFTIETIFVNSDYHARQFNPLCGIDEDPVTGIAAGALGAFIASYEGGIADIVVEQGYCMDKFGIMEVSVGKEVYVKGHAVIYGERVLTV